MIASVQYNDLKGTAVADISDFYQGSLDNYFQGKYKKFDSNKYICRGCSLWIGSSTHANLAFICEDKESKTYVKFNLEKMTIEEALDLFKRLEIVIGENINQIKITQEIDL